MPDLRAEPSAALTAANLGAEDRRAAEVPKGYAWTNGGQGVLESIGTDQKYSSKYGSNGCPDKSASGMFSYCKSKGMDWGTIDTLPEIVGLALFTDGHIGYYVGGGYAVEWRGFNYGCVKTVVK